MGFTDFVSDAGLTGEFLSVPRLVRTRLMLPLSREQLLLHEELRRWVGYTFFAF